MTKIKFTTTQAKTPLSSGRDGGSPEGTPQVRRVTIPLYTE